MLGDQVGDNLGMLGGDVSGLTIVDGKIEELPVRLCNGRGRLGCRLLGGLTFALRSIPRVGRGDEVPASGTYTGLGILADLGIHAFDHVAPATDMGEERAIWPSDILA